MSSQRSGSKYSRGFISQWIGGYCGRPCIGTDRLLCHICMASALTVKPDRSNRNRRDTPFHCDCNGRGASSHRPCFCASWQDTGHEKTQKGHSPATRLCPLQENFYCFCKSFDYFSELKSGVERYRSPESGRRATTVFPANAGLFAT